MENLVATSEMAFYCFEVLEHELALMKNEQNGGKKRKAPSSEVALRPPDAYAYGIPDHIEWLVPAT